MNKCNCGREFTSPQGLGYHKKRCGNIGIDNGDHSLATKTNLKKQTL